MSGRPSDCDALAALRLIASWLGISDANAPTAYTQAELPPDCTSRDAFLRRHRERAKSRVPGWTRSGKTRAVTRDAWEADVREETQRHHARKSLRVVTSPRPAASVDDEVLAELGARRAGGSR